MSYTNLDSLDTMDGEPDFVSWKVRRFRISALSAVNLLNLLFCCRIFTNITIAGLLQAISSR
jgi:hypothetical protein